MEHNNIHEILITGSSGFLGSQIFNYLRKSGFQVSTLGRNSGNTYQFDLVTSTKRLNKKFDVIVHCAGKAHIIPKNQEQEQQYFEINFTGTKNLCNAFETNLPNTFIFISTIAVYGRNEGVNIKESDSLKGDTPYAKSKILAEKYLQKWSKINKVNLVILRLPLVAGKDPKGNLGAMIRAIRKGFYFNISKNNSKKSIVLADDVAALITKLMGKNGTYNLSGDKNYSFQEISDIISKQLGKKNVIALPLPIVSIVAQLGNVIPILPINSISLRKMTSTLTVSDHKAIDHLDWNPTSLKKNFKI